MRMQITPIVLFCAVIGIAFAAAEAQDVNQVRALREKLLKDPHRPGYHFVSPEGRCAPFDPNAAIFWNGRYHLMYIVQTKKGHCWGHVSSTDLVYWRQHPLSLEPGEGDNGIFSGGVFVDKKGVATITYWGLGKPRGICIATSTDKNLDTWTKSPHNPVIRESHWGYTVVNAGKPNQVVYGAADPSAIWVNKGRYYMLTGNLLVLNEFGKKRKQAEHLGDTLYLFVSDDLAKWKYLHPFYKSVCSLICLCVNFHFSALVLLTQKHNLFASCFSAYTRSPSIDSISEILSSRTSLLLVSMFSRNSGSVLLGRQLNHQFLNLIVTPSRLSS